jgi:hypothetical protein
LYSIGELTAAWAALVEHDRAAECPDVIGMTDRYLAQLRGEDAPRMAPAGVAIPKRPGLRRLTVLDPSDEADYRTAVARLASGIERQLGPWVVANRVREVAGLRLEPWRVARRRFRRLPLAPLSGGVLAVADVRDCFPRIEPSIVEDSLVRMGCDPPAVSRLVRLLERFREWGIPGLPVGPEPSAVIANAVLVPADRAVTGEGARHLRWADDFLIRATGRAGVERALQALQAALGRIGLTLAPEKTAVLEERGDPLARVIPRFPSGSLGGTRRDPDPWSTLEGAARPGEAPNHVRLLRRVGARPWGGAEASLLRSLAVDPARPGPVRSWAWRALARADPRSCLEAAAAVDGEADAVRRAVAVAVALVGGPRASRFLRHARSTTDDLRATAVWGLAR